MGCLYTSTKHNYNLYTQEHITTSNLVPIKQSRNWIPLNAFPFSLAGKYVINESNKLYMLPNTKVGSDPIYSYYTYNVDYYRWIPSLHHTAQIHKLMDMYVHMESQRLIRMNVNGSQWNVCSKPIKYTVKDPEFVLVNNELHLIGGMGSRKHYVFNTQINKFKLRSKLLDIHTTTGFRVVYIASKQCLYLFAGSVAGLVVCTYSTETNTWEKLHVRLRTTLFDFGITLTSDNRYVLLFGGTTDKIHGSEYSKAIYIFDVDKCIFGKSKIKCP
eukprot:418118_1